MFASGARTVRCAKCKHSWKAEPPVTIDVVGAPLPEPTPAPEAAAPIPAGSNLPALPKKTLWTDIVHKLHDIHIPFSLGQGLAAAAVVATSLMLIWFILDRQHIAHQWPSLEPIYNAIGLYIYYPGDGLEFDGVRSELTYDSGITKLILNGKIKNKTQKNQKVPPLMVEALGPDDSIIQSWQIDAPVATLGPDEEASFTSSINAPRGSVVHINLNFVETKDDN